MQVKVKSGKPYPGYMSNTYNDFDVFQGEVIPNPKWVSSDSICLSTGSNFPAMRVIKKSTIVSMDDNVYVSDYTEQPKAQTFKVMGSKGDLYCVTAEQGVWSCSCKGYEYRRNCGHINQAKKLQTQHAIG